MSEAQKLANRDPEKDFESEKKNGDIHFLAVKGFVTDVLGVEGSDRAYLKRVPVKVVQGTSDVLGPAQDKRTREKVRDYAERHNRLVVKYLREKDHRSQ